MASVRLGVYMSSLNAFLARAQTVRLQENAEKIKMNKQLPYLVGNVVEVRRTRLLLWLRSSPRTLAQTHTAPTELFQKQTFP